MKLALAIVKPRAVPAAAVWIVERIGRVRWRWRQIGVGRVITHVLGICKSQAGKQESDAKRDLTHTSLHLSPSREPSSAPDETPCFEPMPIAGN